MREPLPIPTTALAGMDGWDITLAWSYTPGRTTWRLRAPNGETRYLKAARRADGADLAAERDRLRWAVRHLPVPAVVAHGADGRHEWLLTSALAGVNATDEGLRADPGRLVPLLAAGLRRFHAAPVTDCPFTWTVDAALDAAARRVAAGHVDPARDFHGEHRHLTAEAALAQIHALRPAHDDLVVCHGDYCLPNVLIDGERVSGFVDIGGLGVSDRWRDIAVATWSVNWNLGPGWEDLFLAAYGLPRDHDKVAFYRLLYDLLP